MLEKAAVVSDAPPLDGAGGEMVQAIGDEGEVIWITKIMRSKSSIEELSAAEGLSRKMQDKLDKSDKYSQNLLFEVDALKTQCKEENIAAETAANKSKLERIDAEKTIETLKKLVQGLENRIEDVKVELLVAAEKEARLQKRIELNEDDTFDNQMTFMFEQQILKLEQQLAAQKTRTREQLGGSRRGSSRRDGSTASQSWHPRTSIER